MLILDIYSWFRIPVAYPAGPEGPIKIRVISGKSYDIESPVRPLGGCWYLHVIFEKAGTVFQEIRMKFVVFPRLYTHLGISIAAGWTAFLYSACLSSAIYSQES
jgi:hypothetical protein